MSECIIQHQCLDPHLVYDSPDCIKRKSCDEAFFDIYLSKTTGIPESANSSSYLSSIADDNRNGNRNGNNTTISTQPHLIHAVPTLISPTAPGGIAPVDVFSVMLITLAAVVLVWAIANMFVPTRYYF